MATSEHPFPNEIPSRHPLPSGFQLRPDARSTTLPVTPVIPPTVANGDVITSLHENQTVAALADLWTNEQWLAAQSLSDPTSAKGDLLARDASALARLAVGTAGQVLTVDAAAPLGVKWAAPAGAVASVFGRTGVVVATAGDYTAALVTNAVSVLGSYADPVWITSLAYAKITGAPAAGVPALRQVIAGSGLLVGGALTADVTLSALAMGASGASHRAGIVPDPGAAAGAVRYLREDATWATPSGAGGGLTDPTTTLGDLIVRGAAATTRFGVGTNGQALLADSTQPLGVRWGTVGGGAVASVFTRTGAVVAQTGDYTAAQVTDAVSILGSYANPAWITSLAWAKITGAPAGGSQTPWTSHINAATFHLGGVGAIGVGISASPVSAAISIQTAASQAPGVLHRDTSAAGTPGFIVLNDLGHAGGVLLCGSGASSVPLRDVLSIYTQQLSNVPITFAPNEVERMRITAAGNVGIGTATPGSLLSLGPGNIALKLAVYDDGASFFGFGVDLPGQVLRYFTQSNFGHAFYHGPTELLRLTPTGGMTMPALPSTNPGAGTKSLWYDPADGNRIKFSA